MLVLTRKPREAIMIGDQIKIHIISVNRDRVRVGIEAPTEIPVHRQDVYEAIQQAGFSDDLSERANAGLNISSQQWGNSHGSTTQEECVSRGQTRINTDHRNGVTVVDFGKMEILDGSDLSLLRDTLVQLVNVDKCRSIGIDMQNLQSIASGFFGMLHAWHQKGVSIRLYSPESCVKNMRWFRQFYTHFSNGCYVLVSSSQPDLATQLPAVWKNGSQRRSETKSKSVAIAGRKSTASYQVSRSGGDLRT